MAVEKLPEVNPPSSRVPGRGLLALPISEALRRRNDGEIRRSGSSRRVFGRRGEDESLVGRLFGTKCVRALLCESEGDNHAELDTVNSWNK
ncbi:hypothetical protein D1007_40103 [Hordeum vulgare]|nr:hypothetical protein D1007_40103 [Hordeum vulgare]